MAIKTDWNIMRIVDKDNNDVVAPWKNDFWYRRVYFVWEKEYENLSGYKLIYE